MEQALALLKKHFGYSSFRDSQTNIIESILDGKDTLGILPTGGGKSLCYQIPALRLGGLTLVISPLISLMKDQVDALREAGVSAAFLNSSQSMDEQHLILDELRAGRIQLLYVAPERIEAPFFLNMIRDQDVRLLAVDEAHCLSQWGHDFRPSYRKIPELIKVLASSPVIAAFTATATHEVREDIIKGLGLRNPVVRVHGFDRPNLYFSVYRNIDKTGFLLDYLHKHAGKSGIIYAGTRKEVERLHEKLGKEGFLVGRYHAGLLDAERKKAQEDFIFERIDIMVATNAFGMGIDKSNVRFVIHYNMPKDMESYYQEAGRAGRDGEPAECVLLYSGADIHTQSYFIEQAKGEAPEAVIRNRYDKLNEMIAYTRSEDCLRAVILRYFGEEPETPKCGNCSNCSDFVEEDITIEAQKIISCVYRANQNAGIQSITDILKGSKNKKVLRNGWDRLSTYGIMSGAKRELIRDIIEALLSKSLLEVSKGEFPVLILGKKAMEFLKNRERLSRKIHRFSIPKEQHGDIDEALFTSLKSLRRTLAENEGIPPYLIFSDKSLKDMAQKKPLKNADFLKIHGVGEAKLAKYGEIFVAFIREHMEK